jgi:general secretion pathway protein L
LQWVVGHQDQVIAQGQAAGPTLNQQLDALDPGVLENANIVFVIPTEQVLLLSCQVPGRNSGQIRQALPYALEEYVAADIESMHIAAGSIKAGQTIHCALIGDEQMSRWKSWLTEHQIAADVLVSEAQLASVSEDCTVFLAGAKATAVYEQSSATVEREELIGLLENLSADRLVVVGEELSELERSQLDAELEVEQHSNVSTFLLERYAKQPPINLFQGPYALVNKKTGSKKDITTLAKLAALWGVIYIIGLGVQGMWSSYQAEQLAADNRNRYVELFPQDSAPITAAQLRRRFEGKLRNQGQQVPAGPIRFVQLLGDTAPIFSAKGSVRSLSYLQDKEEMTIEMELKGYDQVDEIQTELKSRGVDIEVVSAGSIDGGISARIRASYVK